MNGALPDAIVCCVGGGGLIGGIFKGKNTDPTRLTYRPSNGATSWLERWYFLRGRD